MRSECRTERINGVQEMEPFMLKSEKRLELLQDPILLQLHQAQSIAFQYTCFRCMAVCPALT